MYNTVFSSEAIKDLQKIKEYISTELSNEIAADNTVSNILKSIRAISAFPKSGSPLSAVIDYDCDYRFTVCGNYLTFYTFDENYIYVHRVLYGKRNYLRILFNEE